MALQQSAEVHSMGVIPFVRGQQNNVQVLKHLQPPPCMPLLLSSTLQVVVPGADWYTVPLSFKTLMLVPVKGTVD